MSLDIGDAAALLDSFLLHLRAERKSPQTVKTYGDGIRLFLRWCEAQTAITARRAGPAHRGQVDRLPARRTAPRPRPPGPASSRVRRFSAWLAAEGEIRSDQLARMSPPKLYAKAVDPLSDEQLVALLAACKGPELRDKRRRGDHPADG